MLAIDDCPPIADGEGSVVISRIKTHRAGDLIELYFENGETLTGTANHPIWSADRQDWVPLGELQEGEHTQSRDGLLKITHRIALPDVRPVYNLEVHGEHVYEVTRAGLLVHNNTPDCLRLAELQRKGRSSLSKGELDELSALKDKLWTPWKITNPDRTVRSAMGNIYRDPKTGLWWSKDITGHGGSAWKVFKESSTGLDWYRDADKFGDFILDKHKGPTGLFFPWSKLTNVLGG